MQVLMWEDRHSPSQFHLAAAADTVNRWSWSWCGPHAHNPTPPACAHVRARPHVCEYCISSADPHWNAAIWHSWLLPQDCLHLLPRIHRLQQGHWLLHLELENWVLLSQLTATLPKKGNTTCRRSDGILKAQSIRSINSWSKEFTDQLCHLLKSKIDWVLNCTWKSLKIFVFQAPW